MKIFLFLLPLVMVGAGMAYAEPLENVQTSVLDYDDDTATVEISWNNDENISSYEIGCVSCSPNIVKSTSDNTIIISDVTTFPNSSIAMLYGLAYDLENNLISAKQIFVNLSQ